MKTATITDRAHKRHIWDYFEMSLTGEVDRDSVSFHWHWLLFPLIDMVGPELVYSVGLKALDYPPTWVDTQEEADSVESAVIQFLNSED